MSMAFATIEIQYPYTEIGFIFLLGWFDSKEEVVWYLETMLKDIDDRPILDQTVDV
jgi:hypothetical protein